MPRERSSAKTTDDMNEAPADRARQLLAWWADPADADLLAGWLEKQRGIRPVTPALAAASEVEVCSQWAAEHFQREGVASHPPWHRCSAMATEWVAAFPSESLAGFARNPQGGGPVTAKRRSRWGASRPVCRS
jgi:hypothetical protein